MLEKILKWGKKKEEVPPLTDNGIRFGRYSDNNKPLAKVQEWTRAETLFKEQKFHESIAAFFNYLTDDEAGNVFFKKENDAEGQFHFFQGSKVIRGFYNKDILEAEVTLAAMPQPSVPVMRRLLEMNFNLYYTRYALHDGKLTMLFTSDVVTANPSKLYYGLKELATKADKQDDLLVHDFTALQAADVEHVAEIPPAEKEVKYKYLQLWIKETLDLAATVDGDKYAGGVAYLLLALAFRIDFLIVPEGKLLVAIERIVEIYFRKDERPVPVKNHDMMEEFAKLQAKTKDEIFSNLFRSRYTFSIVTPQAHKTIADAIYNANQNIRWYKENKHTQIAAKISEYGIAYCQYSYSLPRPVTELFQLFMMVNYPEYFAELGLKRDYYNRSTDALNKETITAAVEAVQTAWQEKYPQLKMKLDKVKFDSLVSFNQSFTTEIEYLNLETK